MMTINEITEIVSHSSNAAALVNTLSHDATCFESLIQLYSCFFALDAAVDEPAAACI